MGIKQYIVMGALLFMAFAYVMHEFPDAKKALNETLGCFSSFKSPLSSPICAAIDFGGVAFVGRYVAKAVNQGREAVQAVREGKSLAQAAREAEGLKDAARTTEELAEASRAAREARELREMGEFAHLI